MSNQYSKKELINKQELERLYYEENLTYKEIALKKNVSVKVVYNRIKEYDLIPRRQSRRPKERYVRNGYYYVSRPSHPRADDRGRVPEHIVIMEEHIGRFLKYTSINNPDDEIVHHKNKNKLDNRYKNLILTTNREHIKKYHGAVQ